ncbi:MAG: hypothetical protein K2Q06_05400 [Parvularculaceae bacterium]|nr:hypothetical protein [Parvularculaceae bacterium]
MTSQKKTNAAVLGGLIGFALAGAAILALSSVAEAGYDFGKYLRAKHESEAAKDVRPGD